MFANSNLPCHYLSILSMCGAKMNEIEQHNFMLYENELIEGSSEKVD